MTQLIFELSSSDLQDLLDRIELLENKIDDRAEEIKEGQKLIMSKLQEICAAINELKEEIQKLKYKPIPRKNAQKILKKLFEQFYKNQLNFS